MKLILLIILLLGCGTMEEKNRKDDFLVIFIHGFKGSNLYNGEKKYWLKTSDALGFSNTDISLPLKWENGFQKKDSLVAKEVFSEVRIIPYLFSEKVYKPFQDSMKSIYKEKFFEFTYDWRRDNEESLLQFESFLDKIKKENPTKKLFVVSHSMGGMISLALIHKRKDLIDKIVYAGVPFKGILSPMEDIQINVPTGLNSEILAPKVLFSFPSLFSLLPEKTTIQDKKLLSNRELDLFKLDTWVNEQLSAFKEPKNRTEENKEHFKILLSKAKSFRDKLKQQKQIYPKSLNIYSNSHPTISKLELGLTGWNFIREKIGDDRVLEEESKLDFLNSKRFQSSNNHSGILNDEKVILEIRNFFNSVD